jgi:hypothetical protein
MVPGFCGGEREKIKGAGEVSMWEGVEAQLAVNSLLETRRSLALTYRATWLRAF